MSIRLGQVFYGTGPRGYAVLAASPLAQGCEGEVADLCGVIGSPSFEGAHSFVLASRPFGNRGLDSPSEPSSASEIRQQCMREAAEAIGVSYAPGMTASDILSEIRMTVKPLEFSGRPLTEEEIKSASNMLTPEAEAALRQNQKFLSGLKGKKLKVVTSLQ